MDANKNQCISWFGNVVFTLVIPNQQLQIVFTNKSNDNPQCFIRYKYNLFYSRGISYFTTSIFYELCDTPVYKIPITIDLVNAYFMDVRVATSNT